MITINAQTKATSGTREHEPQVFSKWFPDMNITPGYIRGWVEPNFQVPAIRQHYEFGWSLSKSEPVLMHVYSSPYPS